MPDIFGRELHDYKHLRALQERGLLETAQRSWAEERGIPPHDFNALGSMNGRFHNRLESTAQAVGYMTNNLQAIMAMIDEVLYTENRLSEMMVLAYDVPDGAATYSYRVVDRVGEGRFIEFDGTSAPPASASQRIVPYTLHYGGIIPEWTVEDVRRAMYGGFPLDTETIEAGARGAMNHIERVGFTGDTDYGLYGLTNQPVPTIDTAPSGNQVYLQSAADQVQSMTPDNMLTFLQSVTTDLIENTEEVVGRTIRGELCIYMPLRASSAVLQTRIDDTNISVWDFFARNNDWLDYTGAPPMLKRLKELDSAGTVSGGGNNRYIWAIRERPVMEMAVPIMPRVLGIQDTGYKICAPMEYKVSGVNVKRPQTIIYVDPS